MHWFSTFLSFCEIPIAWHLWTASKYLENVPRTVCKQIQYWLKIKIKCFWLNYSCEAVTQFFRYSSVGQTTYMTIIQATSLTGPDYVLALFNQVSNNLLFVNWDKLWRIMCIVISTSISGSNWEIWVNNFNQFQCIL